MSPSASKITMAVFWLGLGFGLSLGLPAAAVADGPPRLDVTPTCEAAARVAISTGRDKASCLADERSAQEALAKDWSSYDAADKVQCVGNVKTGGPPSYVELLSCIEVMRDARNFRKADPALGR
jgi:hypothetical protein